MSRPTDIRAGDTYTYTVSYSGYPASDGWTLRVVIQNATYRVKVDAVANADGVSYDVTLASTNTDDFLTSGVYQFSEAVEKGTGSTLQRHTLYTGSVNVTRDVVSGTSAVDSRTDARIMLDTINVTIKASLGKGHESMSIAARAIGYRSWEEMLRVRSRLQMEVQAEENNAAIAAGLDGRRNPQTRFAGIV